MSVGVQNFYGERLKEARLARGLFMKSLGDMIGVTGTAISRYESGEDKPQTERLQLLAERLNFPVDFFLSKPWSETLEPVFWRSRVSETKSAREMTEQRMKWLCQVFDFLNEEVNFPEQRLPPLDIPSDFRLITPKIIEAAAEAVRRDWGLRNLPIPDMLLALENIGIPVATLEIASDKQDGFCFRSQHLGRAFVGINTYNVSACRARYDAAHELGHIVLHNFVTPEQERELSSRKLIEQQAHRFAGALLFPKDAFISEVASVSLDYFSSLKKRWGISIAAMINRAFDLSLIDSDSRSLLYQSLTRRRWRGPLREPFDDVMPLEQPRMLRRAVEVVINNGIFARSAVRAALPLPQHEFEQLVAVKRGFLGDSKLMQLKVDVRSERKEAVDLESGQVVQFPGRFGRS